MDLLGTSVDFYNHIKYIKKLFFGVLAYAYKNKHIERGVFYGTL